MEKINRQDQKNQGATTVNAIEGNKEQPFIWNEYLRAYRRRNPEKMLKYRLTQARNLLVKHGWTCTPPAGDAAGKAAEQ